MIGFVFHLKLHIIVFLFLWFTCFVLRSNSASKFVLGVKSGVNFTPSLPSRILHGTLPSNALPGLCPKLVGENYLNFGILTATGRFLHLFSRNSLEAVR